MTFSGEIRIKLILKLFKPPPHLGGLNQINVKYFMHNLRTKWMVQLWQDCGSTWSIFVLPEVVKIFPSVILPGITYGAENLLAKLEPFYAGVICLFSYINSLNLESNIQHNIWATRHYLRINGCMVALDYVEVADLPVIDGILDYCCV